MPLTYIVSIPTYFAFETSTRWLVMRSFRCSSGPVCSCKDEKEANAVTSVFNSLAALETEVYYVGMPLNPKQFGTKVFYHGTTPEAAEAISREGFSLGHERHGRSGGEGVYLTSQPDIAREFGPAVVEVSLRKGTKINRGDSFAALTPPLNRAFRAARTETPDLSLEDFWKQHSEREGFGGHKDDDGSIIVYNPQNVGYRSHTVVGMVAHHIASEQFDKRSGY